MRVTNGAVGKKGRWNHPFRQPMPQELAALLLIALASYIYKTKKSDNLNHTSLSLHCVNMDVIVNKIREDLIGHVISYKGDNVTQRLMSDFNHAIFLIIPEKVRIEDMKQSTEFREEMMGVFEEQDPTKPGTPYLGQLKDQDSCYAARNCKFEFGQTLYQCASCKKNFVCEEHKNSTCMLCQASRTTKGLKEKSPDSTGEKKVGELTGSNEDGEDNNHTVNNAEDAESGDEEVDSGDEEAEIGDEKSDSGDEEVNSEDGDAGFRGENVDDKYKRATSEGKDEDKNEGKNVESGKKNAHREKSAVIQKITDQKEDPVLNQKKQERAAKFHVEDIQNLSIDDFKFERGNLITELQVCQVEKRSGEFVWVVLQDYVQLKEMYVKNEANSEGDESEESGFGWKNRENADIGK